MHKRLQTPFASGRGDIWGGKSLKGRRLYRAMDPKGSRGAPHCGSREEEIWDLVIRKG